MPTLFPHCLDQSNREQTCEMPLTHNPLAGFIRAAYLMPFMEPH
jgi:hypothetical protein